MASIKLYPIEKLKEVHCEQCKKPNCSKTYHSISKDDYYDFCDQKCFSKWANKKASQDILADDIEEKVADEEAEQDDDLDDYEWKDALSLAEKTDKLNFTQILLQLLAANAPSTAYKQLQARLELVFNLHSIEHQLGELPANIKVEVVAAPASPERQSESEQSAQSAEEAEEVVEQDEALTP